MRLRGEVLQEERIHRSLQTDMQLADLAFGQGGNGHAGKLEVLEQRCHVRLIAADPVEGLSHHEVEATGLGVLQQRLDARTQDHARPGKPGILVCANNLPALALRPLSAASWNWSSIEAAR